MIVDDSTSEISTDEIPMSPEIESDDHLSSDNHSIISLGATPRAERTEVYPSAATARRQKKEAASLREEQSQYPQRGSSLAEAR